MGGDGTEYGISAGEPQPSIRRRRITSRHASADLERLPPAAVREARNLQNFFPFPWWEEEKEALEDDNVEEEDQKDYQDEDPVDILDAAAGAKG